MATRVDGELMLFLKKHNLEEYRDPIANLKVYSVSQLQDLKDHHLEKMGMNDIEISRFRRELETELNLINTKSPLSSEDELQGFSYSEFMPYRIPPELEREFSKQQGSELYQGNLSIKSDFMMTISEYKRITIESSETLLKNFEAQLTKAKFNQPYYKITPVLLHYLKCGLSFDKILDIWYNNNLPEWPRTNDTIFHSIFQQSDPLVRALCIDDYSLNFPVPFYYPSLSSITNKDDIAVFEICHELWFSFPECLAIASFGVGKAGWLPVGKSKLLDLVFSTNFVSNNGDKSPYHLNSIDVQISKNIRFDSKIAIFDCHSGTRPEVVRTLARNVNILLVHVFKENMKDPGLVEELEFFSKLRKTVIVLIRDSSKIVNKKNCEGYHKIFIRKLTQLDRGDNISIIEKFRGILMDEINSQKVNQSFLEHIMKDLNDKGLQDILDSKERFSKITELIESLEKDNRCEKVKKDSLSFYPFFADYMKSHLRTNQGTSQEEVDKLNRKCSILYEQLNQTRTSPVIECFFELFESEYSPLLLRKLSEYLKSLSKDPATNHKYSVDIIWREALLSFKYDQTRTDSEQKAFTSKLQRCLCKQIMNGEPFELIDGDNLVFHSKDIDKLLQEFYENQKVLLGSYNRGKDIKLSETPIVISILGAQNSGKSTLLNYLFGCRFVTHAGRCTKGVYGSLFELKETINNSKTLLILDTEGLSAVVRQSSQQNNLINFDRTLALFCLAVSQFVIVNIVGDINAEVKNLLKICAYSLNRLKVNKVNLPKIEFVLNQQSDPDVQNHDKCLKSLMDSLEYPMYSSFDINEKVSDLMRMSTNDLTILPSAFNSFSFESPFCQDKTVKYEATEDFLSRCARLKNKIFDELDKTEYSRRPPFENVSEWVQMAGLIWETSVKYQDIVMYRGPEELTFSQELCDIYHKLLEKEIYQKRPVLTKVLDNILEDLGQIEHVFDPKLILSEKMEIFNETFIPMEDFCIDNFESQSEILPNFKNFQNAHNQVKSNLERLIYGFRKGFENKIKFRIESVLQELKLSKSIKTFKSKIEGKFNDYIHIPIDQKLEEFTKEWRECYENDFIDKLNIEEYFATLYANFKMECTYLETRQTILGLFRRHTFDMNNIIDELECNILNGLKIFEMDQPENWYFCILSQSYGDFTNIQPHDTRENCMYLAPNSLIKSNQKREVCEWIPKDLHPIVKLCSCDYNIYEIVWRDCPERIQILRLVSMLRSPKDFNESCWETLLNEVRTRARYLLEKDRELSQTTIRLLITDLKANIRVVNHEIKYIRAMLSDRAERALSTLIFSYAFREFLSYQKEQIKLDVSSREAKKEELREYFLQKIETHERFNEKWNSEKMKEHDIKISKTFALIYIQVVSRFISTTIQNQVERIFEGKTEILTTENLLFEANKKVDAILQEHSIEVNDDSNNFVIQFICNRNTCLKTIFDLRFDEFVTNAKDKLFDEAIQMFKCCITPLVEQFQLLQRYFDELPEEVKIPDCFYSDYNFVLRESSKLCISDEPSYLAMSLFLSKYLNPEISSKDFLNFFKADFEIGGVKVGRSDNSILPEKKIGISISSEEFKRLVGTDIFSKELIFNIYSFIDNFKNVLQTECKNFSLNSDFINQLFQKMRSHYLKDALGCEIRCPSCGKFCEKSIHNDGSKCQIFTGHQISSMGGKVWKNDSSHTAVLFMCDDYQDFMEVKIPGKSMKWNEFKLSLGSDWNWEKTKYKTSKEAHRVKTQKIWNSFGVGILNYFSKQGTHITYTPFTLIELKSIASNYFICFLIDGTGSMRKDIIKARISVSKLVKEYQKRAIECKFRVVIYRDHCDKDIIETCPNDSSFSTDPYIITDFLSNVKAKGGGDGPEAMLDGLAVATSETDWIDDTYSRNILVHIYDAPPHGKFPNYLNHNSISNKLHCCCCNRGTKCHYDWNKDVWIPIKNKIIFYHGINTSSSHIEFEKTMKEKLGELCGEFQVCGKEQVDEAVLQLFVNYHN